MIKNYTKKVSCLIDPKTRKVISGEGDLETVHRKIQKLKWAIKICNLNMKEDKDYIEPKRWIPAATVRLLKLRKLSARMLATQYQSDKREKQREEWKAQKLIH